MTNLEREIASQIRSSEQSSWLISPQSGEIGMRLSIIGQVNELTPEAVSALRETMVQIQGIDDFTTGDDAVRCGKLKSCASYFGPCKQLTHCGEYGDIKAPPPGTIA